MGLDEESTPGETSLRLSQPREEQVMREARKFAVFDSVKAEAFAGEFLSVLNHGALCLMASIGHRTGLFDAMSALPHRPRMRSRKKPG